MSTLSESIQKQIDMSFESLKDIKMLSPGILVNDVVDVLKIHYPIHRDNLKGVVSSFLSEEIAAGRIVEHYIGMGMSWLEKKSIISNTSNPSAAINDHVCPTCKNNRCSKTEKKCWLCGNPL